MFGQVTGFTHHRDIRRRSCCSRFKLGAPTSLQLYYHQQGLQNVHKSGTVPSLNSCLKQYLPQTWKTLFKFLDCQGQPQLKICPKQFGKQPGKQSGKQQRKPPKKCEGNPSRLFASGRLEALAAAEATGGCKFRFPATAAAENGRLPIEKKLRLLVFFPHYIG